MTIVPSEEGSAELRLGRLIERAMEMLHSGESFDVEALPADDAECASQLAELLPVLELLADLSDARGPGEHATKEQPHRADQDRQSDSLAGLLGDYRIIREIGRGGMGIVYEAEQLSLDRRVALKILPFAGVLDQRQLQRFKNEARAAAGLHHPHIVPVYFVGCEKAVHFYAMQYIEGQTLARVISELKGLQTSRDSEEDSPTLSPLTQSLVSGGCGTGRTRSHVGDQEDGSAQANQLQSGSADTTDHTQAHLSTHGAIRNRRFFRSVARLAIQAAQALEYAHQSGVVHRDIKPSNLLIDLDGNLWISDFGLAQTRAGPDLTMTGDVIGTLRYMSPEQADGNRRILDHHTDIYSLGVTLFETLSLRPPFEANDRHQLIHQIIEGNHRPLRSVNTAIPQDLETIVLKAMAAEPETRYGTAQELADDLQRFIDDKPIEAHRPSVLSRMTKWCRRHKPLVAAVIVFLVMTSISLAISTLWVARAVLREAQQRERAETNVRLGLSALDEIYIDVAAERLPRQAHLSQADQSLLRKALRFYEAFAERNEGEPTARTEMAKAYRRVGDIQLRLGEDEEAERSYRRSIAGFQQLADEFPGNREATYGVSAGWNNLGTSLWNQGRSEEAEEAYRRALDLVKTLCDRSADILAYREELARSQNNLAVLLVETDRAEEAERAFVKARTSWQQLAHVSPHITAYRYRLAACLSNLANVWMEIQRYDEAEQALVQSLEIVQELVADTPEEPIYNELLSRAHNNMAVLLRRTDRVQDAESFFGQALLQWQILGDRFPHVPEYGDKLKRTCENLLQLLDKRPETEDSLRRALAIRKELAETFPHVDQYRDELARNHVRLAGVLSKQQRLAEAERSLRSAIALWEALEAVASDALAYRKNLAQAYNNLGILCRSAGRTTAATDAFRSAVGMMEELAPRYVAVPAFDESMAKARFNLGRLLGTSEPEEAEEALNRARRTFDELAGSHPTEPCYEVNLAASLAALGNLLTALGRGHDAGPLLREAIQRRRRLAAQLPDDADCQNSLAWLLANCADPALRDPPHAVDLARKVVELDPKRASSWNTLGAAHFRAGEWASAIEALRKSIELGGEGSDWFFLALAHRRVGDKAEARECYDRAVEWMELRRPHDAELHVLKEEARKMLLGNEPH